MGRFANALEEFKFREGMKAEVLQRQINSLGYDIAITSLTTIDSKVTTQKFFQLPPAEYFPIRVGIGAWSDQITTYRDFSIADEFETGIVNVAGGNTRLANADAAVDSLTIKVFDWAKSNSWSLIELQKAAKSGNWDLITSKMKSRKKNWDLGIQRIAFLGADGQNGTGGNCFGLLNQPGVTVNTTVITAPISGLSVSALKTFCQQVVEAFRSNCNRTAYPKVFAIPESDYNGMASQASADFPIKSVKEVLEETFKTICMDPQFKILPCAYGDSAFRISSGFSAPTIVGKQVYSLHTMDDESIRMDIPVDYTTTLPNSIDNFGFQSAAYGEFTGVLAYRPLEQLLFQY